MKNHYIQAVIEMIQSGKDAEMLFSGLKRTMQSKGHIRLYASVLRGVLRVIETKQSATAALVTVAKESDLAPYADVIKTILTALGSENDFSTEIDDTIIGGVIIKNSNTIVDSSYKTALTNLYRATTK